MHRAAALVLVAVMAALGACAGETSDNNATGTGTRPGGGSDEGAAQEAPDFSFETFEGDTFSLAEQRGTPVVLNFWESW
jgi:cytochrome oxidase Cu insertion factor (SCO1/SenC/PrrC family)